MNESYMYAREDAKEERNNLLNASNKAEDAIAELMNIHFRNIQDTGRSRQLPPAQKQIISNFLSKEQKKPNKSFMWNFIWFTILGLISLSYVGAQVGQFADKIFLSIAIYSFIAMIFMYSNRLYSKKELVFHHLMREQKYTKEIKEFLLLAVPNLTKNSNYGYILWLSLTVYFYYDVVKTEDTTLILAPLFFLFLFAPFLNSKKVREVKVKKPKKTKTK